MKCMSLKTTGEILAGFNEVYVSITGAFIITDDKRLDHLQTLNISKPSGPDFVSQGDLKNIAYVLVIPTFSPNFTIYYEVMAHFLTSRQEESLKRYIFLQCWLPSYPYEKQQKTLLTKNYNIFICIIQ